VDFEKFNSRRAKLILYLLPFALLIPTQLDYFLFMAKLLQPVLFVLFILLHLLFLLAICNLLTMIIMEFLFTLLEDRKKSSLHILLYKGRSALPVRNAIYVAAFIIAYVVLIQILTLQTIYQFMVLILPTLAIAMNTRYFLSGRIRLINGHYLVYKGDLRIVISYSTDENGNLIFLTSDGKIVKSDVTIADPAFKQLEAEFKVNSLHQAPSA
jgi:hypothetical protein